MKLYSQYSEQIIRTYKDMGAIELPYPKRPPELTPVIGLACDPIPIVRIGIIGLGRRGPKAVKRLNRIAGTQIVALADFNEERTIEAAEIVTKMGKACPYTYFGSKDCWQELCRRDDLDLVYITTNWGNHCEIATYAMSHGHHVAIEVPAAMDLDEIWQLVTTAEQTRMHCMQLENCVYDYFELETLNMVRHGLLGDLVEVDGGYIHYLHRVFAEEEGYWRLKYNRDMRGDLYATHGIGPACQILDIHRSDQLNCLIAMDTSSISGARLYKTLVGEESPAFANADQTDTLIRTARGRMIHLRHNVMTPRPYSRRYNVTGTLGYASKYPEERLCLLSSQTDETKMSYLTVDEMTELRQEWQSPLIQEVSKLYPKYDEWGGKNFIMDFRLIRALRQGLPLDMDVYDLAEWCAVGELSRLSLELGGRAIKYPDFTRGGTE